MAKSAKIVASKNKLASSTATKKITAEDVKQYFIETHGKNYAEAFMNFAEMTRTNSVTTSRVAAVEEDDADMEDEDDAMDWSTLTTPQLKQVAGILKIDAKKTKDILAALEEGEFTAKQLAKVMVAIAPEDEDEDTDGDDEEMEDDDEDTDGDDEEMEDDEDDEDDIPVKKSAKKGKAAAPKKKAKFPSIDLATVTDKEVKAAAKENADEYGTGKKAAKYLKETYGLSVSDKIAMDVLNRLDVIVDRIDELPLETLEALAESEEIEMDFGRTKSEAKKQEMAVDFIVTATVESFIEE